MKRVALLVVLFCLLSINAFAASSATEVFTQVTPTVFSIKWSWTAHTDGSFTSVASREDVDGYVFLVVVNPGATAPQASYDIALNDADSVDVMGGAAADRSATASEDVVPLLMTGATSGEFYGPRFVRGPLTLAISNNNVNGAVGTVEVFFERR